MSGNMDSWIKKTVPVLRSTERKRVEYVNDDKECVLYRSREATDAVRAGGTANHTGRKQLYSRGNLLNQIVKENKTYSGEQRAELWSS